MAYRVLIVDDEPGIAQGLEFLVEHIMPECRVIGIAMDGAEGIEKALSAKPDIILSDIRMPDMDGLEMIRRLRALGSSARFIILSGHAEFEYARTAISLGVKEYLTKPVDEDALLKALRSVCRCVEEAFRMQAQTFEMEHALVEYTLKDILMGNVPTQDVHARLKAHSFPVSAEGYACIVVEMNNEIDLVELKRIVDVELDFCQERIALTHSERTAIIVIAHCVPEDKLIEALGEIHTQISPARMGVGRTQKCVEEIRASYTEAQQRLDKISARPDIIEEAKAFIHKNYTKNISLNDIAEQLFINPYYFSQLFKKKAGQNYHDYLISLRVTRAKRLLEETDLKLYEICELIGYKDVKHFNRIFGRIAGCTPSAYRKAKVSQEVAE